MGHGNAWYRPPCTDTVRKDGGARLWTPFRQRLLCADGPLMAPQLATKSTALSACSQASLEQTRPPSGRERLPYFAAHKPALLIPHSHNRIKLQNICTLTPTQTRARHPTIAASVLWRRLMRAAGAHAKTQKCAAEDR